MVFDMILTLDAFADQLVFMVLFGVAYTVLAPFHSTQNKSHSSAIRFNRFFLLTDTIDLQNENLKTGATTLSQGKKCFYSIATAVLFLKMKF